MFPERGMLSVGCLQNSRRRPDSPSSQRDLSRNNRARRRGRPRCRPCFAISDLARFGETEPANTLMPILAGGRLVAAIPKSSPKGWDLRRDPRCVIHALPGPEDDEMCIRAIAAEVLDDATRALVRSVIETSNVGGMLESVSHDPLFEFDLEQWSRTVASNRQPGTRAKSPPVGANDPGSVVETQTKVVRPRPRRELCVAGEPYTTRDGSHAASDPTTVTATWRAGRGRVTRANPAGDVHRHQLATRRRDQLAVRECGRSRWSIDVPPAAEGAHRAWPEERRLDKHRAMCQQRSVRR